MPVDRRLIELSHSNHSTVTAAMVQRSGLTPSQWNRLVRQDIWVPVVPGVWRHEATPASWDMKVQAGSTWLGADAALYGVTAAAWLGLEDCDTDRVGFLTPRGRRHLPPWLELHTTLQWTKGDTVLRRGVRTCTATRAIIDMARDAPPRQLESAIDSGIRLRLTAVPRLTRRIEELGGSGRAGVQMLRVLMLDSGGESRLEREFLRLLHREAILAPKSQIVYRANGRTLRVDFEFVAHQLVVEVSGKLGHSTDRDRQRDARRRNELQRLGRTVLEFTTADVFAEPGYVIATVREHLHVMPRAGERRSRHDVNRG